MKTFRISSYNTFTHKTAQHAMNAGQLRTSYDFIPADMSLNMLANIGSAMQSACDCSSSKAVIRSGILYHEQFYTLLDIIQADEGTSTVGEALHQLHLEHATFEVSLTAAEIVEISHRLNCATARFKEAYNHDEYSPDLKRDAGLSAWRKLSAIQRAHTIKGGSK
jgi:hypothetical protein